MTAAKPTPGPWYAHGGSVYADAYPNVDRPIAHMDRTPTATAAGIYPVERDTNARLIAAAPEMLAALEALLAEAQDMNADLRKIGHGRPDGGAHPDAPITMAVDAIQKARG